MLHSVDRLTAFVQTDIGMLMAAFELCFDYLYLFLAICHLLLHHQR